MHGCAAEQTSENGIRRANQKGPRDDEGRKIQQKKDEDLIGVLLAIIMRGLEMYQSSKSDPVEVIIDDDTSRGISDNVQVTIDRKKCNYSMYDPLGCKKCLQICPVNVLATRPRDKRDFSIPPKERIDPTIWVLLPTWADWCNGCGACIRECPKGAITIEIDGRTLAS